MHPTKQQKGAPHHVNYHDFDPDRRSEQMIYEINVMDFDLVPENEEPDVRRHHTSTRCTHEPRSPTSYRHHHLSQMTFVMEAEEGQTIPAIDHDSRNGANASITCGSGHYRTPR